MNPVIIKKVKTVTVDLETNDGNYVMAFEVDNGRPTDITQTREESVPHTDYELKFSGEMRFLSEKHSLQEIDSLMKKYNGPRGGLFAEQNPKQLMLDYSHETALMNVYIGGRKVAKDLTVRDAHVFVAGMVAHKMQG